MSETVIVAAARTPFGRFGGTLKDVHSTDLGAHVIQEVLRRAAFPASRTDFVCMGHVQPSAGQTPTRQAVLKSGLPQETLSLTLDRACCSGLTAVGLAFTQIRAGESHAAVAGGMENMSRTPLLVHNARWGTRLGVLETEDPNVMVNPFLKTPRVIYVAKAALEHGEGREAQDRWALLSQQRYAAAEQAGKFVDEVVPIVVPQKKGPPIRFNRDEPPRPDTTYDKLAALPTVYGSETVTAGNAPGLNDGAAALLLLSSEEARRTEKSALASIVSYAAVSGDPVYSVRLPAAAIQKALDKAKLPLDEMHLIEINEAYAAMPLVSTRLLADGDERRLAALRDRTNVNGGAVAIGHAIGASGARILMTLLYELQRRGGGYGVAAICGGIGQADAMVIKVD